MIRRTLLACLLLCLGVLPLQAEPGISSTEIILGQSAAQSGPAEALGQGMKLGMEVYFNEVNGKGGIHGRQIRLITRDDGYEPDRAEANTRSLIEEHNVFALIGEVGTPTSKMAVPVAGEQRVPFLAPFTGAEFLRNADKDFVINVRGSYYQEMERLAEYLVDKKGLTRIACFYQADGYGRAGLAGIEKALQARKLELCATGTYPRNTVDVANGLEAIAAGKPHAVIMVGAYKPCATFIKMARQNSSLANSTFCNISFVGTLALQEELGEQQEGCITSQVVPFPWDSRLPLVREFHRDMNKVGQKDQIGFTTLEGYMAARFFCMALERIQGPPTRESLLATIYSGEPFNLGGVSLEYGPGDNQGMDRVFLTEFSQGRIRPIH